MMPIHWKFAVILVSPVASAGGSGCGNTWADRVKVAFAGRGARGFHSAVGIVLRYQGSTVPGMIAPAASRTTTSIAWASSPIRAPARSRPSPAPTPRRAAASSAKV